MKIAMHFRAFLEAFNYLDIPRLGRFEVISALVESANNLPYARRLLKFYPADQSRVIDNHLVEYLCDRLQVEPQVVYSDLDYFSDSCRELLIQGLEAEIPGLGYLNMDISNRPEFSSKSRYATAPAQVKKLKPALMGQFFGF